MKKEQIKGICQAITDILMFVGIILSIISSSVFESSTDAVNKGARVEDVFSWGNWHCILSVVVVILMIVHFLQHFDFVKQLFSEKFKLKHIYFSVVSIAFILLLFSLFQFLIGFSEEYLEFHEIVVHLFSFIILIHIIAKANKFIMLLK